MKQDNPMEKQLKFGEDQEESGKEDVPADQNIEENHQEQVPVQGNNQEDHQGVPAEGDIHQEDQQESDNNNGEQAPAVAIVQQEQAPAEDYLKPHLACEIYNALPAIHQRRLLTLCRHIFEKGPSADEFTKYMILRWKHNRWMVNSPDQSSEVSTNGLNVSHTAGVSSNHPNALAMLGIEFPPTRLEGPQVCYFETKRIQGYFIFGFCARDTVLPTNIFGVETGGRIYLSGHRAREFPLVFTDPTEVATIGCGLIKQFGERKIFFTKNGNLIEKPILLPPTPTELFPFIWADDVHRLEETNFGLQPFQFKYEGNEAKLAEKIVWE